MRDKLAGVFNPVFGGWAYFTAVQAMNDAEDRYNMPASPNNALHAEDSLVANLSRWRDNEMRLPAIQPF